jgi:hypothetical protein
MQLLTRPLYSLAMNATDSAPELAYIAAVVFDFDTRVLPELSV